MAEKRVNLDTIRKIMDLASLDLDDDARDSMSHHLGRVLEWMEILSGVDTAGVRPAAHALDSTCPTREDVTGPRETAGAGGSFFVVPRIIEDGK